jgi:hypothetical protein
MIKPIFNFNKEQIAAQACDIALAFEWSQTPQGFNYWLGVYNNLQQISELSEALDENKELSS